MNTAAQNAQHPQPDPETTALSSEAIATALKHLPEWTGDCAGISRSYTFADFPQAVGFMSNLVTVIDALNHHPEWTNMYNTVSITLRTHDADDQVTAKDLTLAALLEQHAHNILNS